MAKLEGYKAVAVTKEGYYKYSYAIYDDGETYDVGDKILVSGTNKDILTIDEILTTDECNVNKEKVKRKKEADKIKKQMDKMITEMDQTKRYEMYASDNPELAEKLKVYKELIGEK